MSTQLTTPAADRWMTPKQAAAYLQVSLRTLQIMQAECRIPFSRIGEKIVRFDRLAIDRWAALKAESMAQFAAEK